MHADRCRPGDSGKTKIAAARPSRAGTMAPSAATRLSEVVTCAPRAQLSVSRTQVPLEPDAARISVSALVVTSIYQGPLPRDSSARPIHWPQICFRGPSASPPSSHAESTIAGDRSAASASAESAGRELLTSRIMGTGPSRSPAAIPDRDRWTRKRSGASSSPSAGVTRSLWSRLQGAFRSALERLVRGREPPGSRRFLREVGNVVWRNVVRRTTRCSR